MAPPKQLSENEQYWRDYAYSSCCGTVERGARIIAWLSIVFGAIAILVGGINAVVCGKTSPEREVLVVNQNGTFSQNGSIFWFANKDNIFFDRNECKPEYLGTSFVGNAIVIFASYLIILAQKKREPALYLPYIVLSILSLIIYAVLVFLFVAIASMFPIAFIWVAVLVAIFALMLWMFRIVWRAYRVLKEEVRTGAVVPKV